MQQNDEIAQRVKHFAIAIWAMLGLIILVVGIFLLISNLRQIFALFFYTVAIVYILSPVVDFFEGRGVPRFAAVAISYLIVMLFIALMLIYLIPIIVNQASLFIKEFPAFLESEIKFLSTWRGRLLELRVPPSAIKLLEQTVDQMRETGFSTLSSAPSFTLNIFSIIFYFILAPFLAFYLLKDLDKVRKTIIELIPRPYQSDAEDILEKVDQALSGFLRGQFLVALAVGILASVILTIIGVDFSIVLGIIIGVLNIVPYFGPILGGLIAALVAFFEAPILALWVVLGMLAINITDSTLLSPNIMGQQVDLHPVLIAFSLLIGGSLLGLLGIFIAIPTAAVGKALVYHFIERSEKINASAEFKGET